MISDFNSLVDMEDTYVWPLSRDQSILLLLLPFMLCCNALKIHLLCSILCSRTRLLSDYYSIYIQFYTSNSLHISDITESFVKDCFIGV